MCLIKGYLFLFNFLFKKAFKYFFKIVFHFIIFIYLIIIFTKTTKIFRNLYCYYQLFNFHFNEIVIDFMYLHFILLNFDLIKYYYYYFKVINFKINKLNAI
jgi:hypothetical protein